MKVDQRKPGEKNCKKDCLIQQLDEKDAMDHTKWRKLKILNNTHRDKE